MIQSFFLPLPWLPLPLFFLPFVLPSFGGGLAGRLLVVVDVVGLVIPYFVIPDS